MICLGSCNIAYSETSLPASAFPGTTAFIYWDDLYIYAATSQGMYYAAQGNSPNRTLVFEFYMSHFSSSTRYYRFQAVFFEDQPNVVQYKYFEASDRGVSCTIGVQGKFSTIDLIRDNRFDFSISVWSSNSVFVPSGKFSYCKYESHVRYNTWYLYKLDFLRSKVNFYSLSP